MEKLIFNKSFINGEWKAITNETFDVYNPADGSLIAKVADGRKQEIFNSVESAYLAFSKWKKRTAKDRAEILEKWYNLIIKNKDALAELMTMECGKPFSESLGEVMYGASFIKWFAEEGKRTYGDVIPSPSPNKRIIVLKEPIGVVGIITPWNFPLAMITRKVGAALAAGCTAVIKPSEETPLTALALAELAKRANLPRGVINVVVGKNSELLGKSMCANDKVRKISFTGSTRVGQILSKQSVGTLKKLSLELGGNAPFIVFEDAKIDEAVRGAIASKFRNAGQTCVCVNRFLVHEKVYKSFTEKLVKAVSELKVGDGMEAETSLGPLINKKAIEKNTAFVRDALDKGGNLLLGGKSEDGCFFQPTVIGDSNSRMELAQEEIFGPIAPIFRFTSDEEAIHIANNTNFGLAAYFYSQDVSRIWKVAEALEYGMIGINEGMISTEVAPFGGVKYSGQGREGSKYGMRDYLEIKYICQGL